MEDKRKIGILIAIGIALVIQALISVPIGNHLHRGVVYEFNAEVTQCKSALENYNDKLPDLINYERTNTDNMAINNQYTLRKCRKVIRNPDHYLKSRYIGFWTGVVLINIFCMLILNLISILIAIALTGEKEELIENGYY